MFSLASLNSSTCIHTSFPDVAGSQNHNLHGLVGHTVQQRVLRDGDQQKVARAAAAVHGSWRWVASQPHLALLWTPLLDNKTLPISHSVFPATFLRVQWPGICAFSRVLLILILVLCVQSSKNPKYSTRIPSTWTFPPSFSPYFPCKPLQMSSFECIAIANRWSVVHTRCLCAERAEGGRKTLNHPIEYSHGISWRWTAPLSHILRRGVMKGTGWGRTFIFITS